MRERDQLILSFSLCFMERESYLWLGFEIYFIAIHCCILSAIPTPFVLNGESPELAKAGRGGWGWVEE